MLILSPIWIINNWYSLLNRFFPFDNLTHKVAVDGVDIIDYSDKDFDIDEIFLVDTLTNEIRQVTDDNFINENPFIDNGLVFFKSKRYDVSDSIFVYDLKTNTIQVAK